MGNITGMSLVAMVGFASAAHADTIVYSQDFNSALGAEWSNVTTLEAVPSGFSALPSTAGGAGTFGGSMLRNTTGDLWSTIKTPPTPSTLTLTGLPAHTHLSISFLLAVIDSWDGGTAGWAAPDFFNVRVDGVVVFSESFAITSGAGTYDALAMDGRENHSSAHHPDRGFGDHGDNAWDLSFASAFQNIPHTSDTIKIEFFASGAGWQGGDDESWGIDNFKITIVAVPLPTAAWAGLAGLGLLGGLQWRAARR